MKVQQILQRKGSASVETTADDSTVAAVVAQLAEKRIGCLVVASASKPLVGIVSERDIVRRMGENGAAALDQPVSEIMTAAVITCAPEDDALSVLTKMTEGRFRHMPVLDKGALIGLISIGDVVKARIDDLEHENEVLEDVIRSATA